MPRRLLRIASGALGLLALGAVFLYLSDPVFWRRLATFPGPEGVVAVDWYRPLEAVPGEERAELVMAGPEQRSVSRAALDEALAYGGQTGSVALLIWHSGALQLEHYWPGYDRNTRTDSAALHKTVLGLLYGAAIADGVIRSLDEPAASYLPEWREDARAAIRIRDLLQMSSGLEVAAFSANPFTRWWQLLLGDDVTAVALSVPAVRAPGGQFEYSNFNSQVLGIALQRASGRRYAQYLSERLWSRLGAASAFVWLDHEGGMARTYCCLQATARAWLRVGRLILDQGRVGDEQVVPASWIAEMTTPAATNRNYGLHVWLGSPAGATRGYNAQSTLRARHSEPFAAADVVFLDGNGGQRVYIVPSAQLVIVRTGTARADWDDARLPNAILRGVIGASDPPPAAAGSGAGPWRSASRPTVGQPEGLLAIASFDASNPRFPCSTLLVESGASIGASGTMGVGLGAGAAGRGVIVRGAAGATGFGAAATAFGAALRGAARLAFLRGAARFAALRGAALRAALGRLADLRATFLDPLRLAESFARPLLRCALRRAFFFAAIAHP